MKRISTLLSICIVLLGAKLPAQGIEFFHGSMDEAKAMAASSGKLIFMDAYTTWCGPCKWMAANTFTDNEVGAFFNRHFINVKMDMEKGEGPGLADELNVRAYPTLFFLDGAGESVLKTEGARDPAGLLELGRKALKKANGGREPVVEPEPFDPGNDPVDPDWVQPESAQDPALEKLEKSLLAAVESGDRAAFDDLMQQLLASDHPNKYTLFLELHEMYCSRHGDVDRFAADITTFMDEIDSDDPTVYNNAAWYFFTLVDDLQKLEKAAVWAKKSIDLEPQFYNHDTYAMLQFKLGNNKKAIKHATIAINIAKETGQDYSETEAALRAMRGESSEM